VVKNGWTDRVGQLKLARVVSGNCHHKSRTSPPFFSVAAVSRIRGFADTRASRAVVPTALTKSFDISVSQSGVKNLRHCLLSTTADAKWCCHKTTPTAAAAAAAGEQLQPGPPVSLSSRRVIFFIIILLCILEYRRRSSQRRKRAPMLRNVRVDINKHIERYRTHPDLAQAVRFPIDSYDLLCDILRDSITRNERMAELRGGFITSEASVFMTLRWLAGGSFLDLIYLVGCSRSTFYALV
jgi:hypothetical protein